VIPFSHYSAYYVYGGSVPTPVTGANNMLHWEAIKQFRKLGVKRYDFVGVRINPEKGSKQEGLMMFKQRFGGQLIKGYMWKYAIRPIKFAVYSIAVRLLRGGDIVDNERTRLKAL
jgi:lipid II:glycine glycyltransferase (peptidoglycan interpeptide bridge formation enzyme)